MKKTKNTLFDYKLSDEERSAFLIAEIQKATKGHCEDLIRSEKFRKLICHFTSSRTATNFEFWTLMNLFHLPSELTNIFTDFSIKNPNQSKDRVCYDEDVENEIYLLVNEDNSQEDWKLLNELNLFYANIIGIIEEKSSVIDFDSLDEDIKRDLDKQKGSRFHEGTPEVLIKIYSKISSKSIEESRAILEDYWGITWYYEMCLGII